MTDSVCLTLQGAKTFLKTKWARGLSEMVVWRHISALAAALNILVLMAGNMVGFVVGLDGVTPLLEKVFADPMFIAGVLGTLFAAAQLMFAIRRKEEVQGQSRNL